MCAIIQVFLIQLIPSNKLDAGITEFVFCDPIILKGFEKNSTILYSTMKHFK